MRRGHLVSAMTAAICVLPAAAEGPVRWLDPTLDGLQVELAVGAALCGGDETCRQRTFTPRGSCAYSELIEAEVAEASAAARVGGLITSDALWLFTEGFAAAEPVRGGGTVAAVQSRGSISRSFELVDHCAGCPFEVAVGIVDGEIIGSVGAAVTVTLGGEGGPFADVSASRCGAGERSLRTCEVAAGDVLDLEIVAEVRFRAEQGGTEACPACGERLAVASCGRISGVAAADLLTGCRPVVGETDGIWVQLRPTPCRGDANRDGVVDVVDLVEVILGRAFVDCDGVLDAGDLITVVEAWGACPDGR